MCSRANLRRRWVSAGVLAVLVGVVSAVVLAGFAGARRTASSYDRFVAVSRASDVYVFPGHVSLHRIREFERAPFIAALAPAVTLQIQLPGGVQPSAGAPLDGRFGLALERPRIVAGRAANPNVANEIAVAEPLAQARGLHVGDTLPMQSYSPAQVDALRTGAVDHFPDPGGPTVRLRVVGISRLPSDLSLSGAKGGIFLFTRAFTERYASKIGSYSGDVLSIRLRHGVADIPRLSRRARAFFGKADTFDVQPLGESTAGVQQSIDLLSLGAALFAGIAAIAGLTAVGLALGRRIGEGLAEHETLRSIGLTRPERALAVGLPAVPIAFFGALLGVLGAWLASPIMPMGLARKAEPNPGLDFDPLVLGIGFVAIVVALVALVAVIAWRTARVLTTVETAESHTTAVARTSERLGVAPSASIGVRTALEVRGRKTGVPVRAALVGTIAAVLGVSGVLVFGASLARLERTPGLFGFNWDARVIDGSAKPAEPDHPCTLRRSRLTAVPGVGDVASICSVNIDLGGRPIVAFGLTSIRGAIEPTVVDGRAPRNPREVAVGAHTLATLGRGIGDRVRALGPHGPVEYRIVGVAAAPRFNDAFEDPVPVDDGAFFTGAGLDAVDDPTDTNANVELLIRVAPSANRNAVLRRVEQIPKIAAFDGGPGVGTAATPVEVERLQQIDKLPFALGSFLALLGVVAVGFALASSVRGRRRDLAILKTLGFSHRQVSATVAWQASTMALVGLAVGVPLGVVVGRAIWRAVAHGIGIVPTPYAPIALLLVVGVVTVGVVNLIAALPARAAARTRPALVLRSE